MGLNKRLIGAGATASGALTPSENFKVVTFTGDGTSSKFIEVGFTPDFVWIKGRNASSEHKTIDSSRTAGCLLYTNLTNAEDCNSSHAVIETNGFNVKGNPNVNGREYVAWCWKANGGTTSSNTDGDITSTVQANTDSGFSIVTWTGDGNVSTVGHGLSKVPEMVITKGRANLATYNQWATYHHSLAENHLVYLNLTNASENAGADKYFDDSAFSNTVFGVGDDIYGPNVNGTTMVAYCFHSVDGFSKFGTYTGTGAAGNLIETGFEPAFIMIKRTDDAASWLMFDNKRNLTNPRNNRLEANNADAEVVGSTSKFVYFYSNGFEPQISNSDINASGATYIYMAFASDPDTEAPTLADSFAVKTYTGNSGTQSITGLDFSPNLVWIKERGPSAENHNLFDTLRGATKFIQSNNTNAESTGGATLTSFDADGFTLGLDNEINDSASTYVAWAWKADDNEPTAFFNSSVTGVYKFEDNVNDVAGNNNGASAVSLSYTSSGKFNKAVVSNGTNSVVSLSQTPPMTTAWTFSFWFYATDLSGTDIRVILQTGTGFAIGTEMSKIYIFTGGSNRGSGTSISANTWYHYAATYDGTSLKTYLNGSLAETITTLTGMSAGNLKLFDPPYAGWNHYAGRLDQLRVYSVGLSSTQITALYNESASDNDTVEFPDGLPNGSIASIVSANANAGFSIVKWTGDGVARKIPHGLSAVPEMIITKRLTGTSPWYTYNAYLNGGTNPAHYFVNLNTDAGEASNGSSDGSLFNSTPPTSTIFNIGTSLSGSGDDYIAYCFHSVSGYSKFGSYTGNGSSQSITTGFQPDWLMFKRIDQNGWYWEISDTVRGIGVDLAANTTSAEQNQSPGNRITINTDGFTHTTANYHNISGASYIYMAIKIN